MMMDLTTGKPIKNLVIFTLPIFAGNILQQLYNVVDSIIVGRFVGKDALAAVGTSYPIIMILVALLMGLNVGTEIMLSHSIGERNHEKTNLIANTMFSSVMIISVVIGILGAVFSRQLLAMIQTPETIINDAAMYLRIIFLGLPGLAGYNTLNGMIRSSGNTVLPLAFLAIATVTNIILDIIFVKVFGLGVMGVAFATIIAQTASFLLCLSKLKGINEDFRLKLNLSVFDIKALKNGIKLGVPAAVQRSAMSFAAFATQAFVNKLILTDIIAAYAIGMKVDTFAALPVMSLSLAMVTMIGQNVGAGNEELTKKYEKYGKIGGVIFGGVMTLIILLWGDSIVSIFIDSAETEVIRNGALYVRMLSAVYIFVTYFEIAFGVMKGRGKTHVPMILSIVGIWFIRIPLAWILINQYGFYGLCLAIPISWLATFLLTAGYEISTTYKKKKELEIGKQRITGEV
ncbi:MAG: MATE family efflux transporter [Clostridiales bacterium]|nr:MATE family efflux transporter [Clostridiales bacterium]